MSSARDRGAEQGALVSVAQAAGLLGVHPNTIRSWAEAGRLPAFRINARGDRRFRRQDVEHLLGTVPDQAAMTTPAQRDAELAILVALAQGPVGGSPVAICRSAIDALRRHLGCPRVAIYLGSGATLRLETSDGYREPPPATIDRSTLENPGTGPSLRHAPILAPDLRIPMRAAGSLVGALVVPSAPEVGVEPGLLRTVANAIGGAIHSARLLSRARRELTRSRALQAITKELTGQLDLPAVLDDVVDRTRSLFAADKAGLWMVVEDAERPFQLAAARGIGDEFQRTVRNLNMQSPTLGVRAAVDRRTYVVRNANGDPSVGTMYEIYVHEGIVTACLVPLVSGDRTVGILGLYHTRDHEWPDEELTLAQSFANQAAVAISNARLYRSVAEQAARMRSIHDLSARLNRLTDVRAIADAIVAETSTLAAYHDIRVYEVDWSRGVCEPIAYTRRLLGEGDFREKLRVVIGEGSFTGWVAERGEPLLVNDALHDERGFTIEGTDDIEESMLVVPMMYEGRALGVVALSKLGVNQFSTDDLQTMLIFAGYAAQAVANARSYERLEEQSAELARQLQSQRRLLEINDQLLSTLDQQKVLDMIADGLRSVVHYDNLSIYRADHERRILSPVLTRERHAEQVARYIIPFGHGLMGWAVDHAEPVVANDALNDPRAMQIPGTPADPEALCVVPLVSDQEVIGSLNISRIGGPEAYFSEHDFEIVKLFAGQASIALRNAERHHLVRVQAETDALTGLGNHGAFQRDLGALIVAATEQGDDAEPMALLMMDLDQFKAYNDRLGHPAGDALLTAVGQAIQRSLRTDDRVYRYGGDEFALVLRGADAGIAGMVAERVRGAVGDLTRSEPTPVTISVGIATWPADASGKDGLITAADTALYFGKQAGENRVVQIADVPREVRDIRGTLDELARAALRNPEDPDAVEHLVEHAARLTAETEVPEMTVRDTLLSVARSLDTRDVTMRAHADRVGRLARDIAEELGCDDDETRTVELAARLHGLDIMGADELGSVRSLRDVSEVLRGYAALAGGRARSRRAMAALPRGAEVVHLANVYDMLTDHSPAGSRLDRRAALGRLAEAAGVTPSPAVRDALERALAHRRGGGVMRGPRRQARGAA
jgi:diguanylate cyclase (GGDEF)-like protein/excisionase family DNA binding protein